MLIALALPVRWSMLLLSQSVGHCCYSSCQVISVGGQCCYSACQEVNAVTLPLCWYKLLRCLFAGVSCCSFCQVDILLLFAGLAAAVPIVCLFLYGMLSWSCYLHGRMLFPAMWTVSSLFLSAFQVVHGVCCCLSLSGSLRPFSMGQLSMLLFSPHGVLCFYWLLYYTLIHTLFCTRHC